MSSTSTRMAHGRNPVHNRLDRAERSMVIGVADGSRTRYLRSHNPVLYLVSYSHHQEALT